MDNVKVMEMENVKEKELSNQLTNFLYYFIKRLIDIIVGLVGLILLIPTAIIIKIVTMCNKDFAPIIFKQERIGKNGKIFKMYKFRTMIPNAEEELEKLMKNDSKIKKEYTTNKKLEDDPRITKVGSFLRKTSIDELPQLINVLLNQMTLIGPRPYLPREKDDMGEYYNYVINCKPGLTGLWQVSGRNDVSFNYRLKLDKKYVLERTLKMDAKIFFKTFSVVILKKGAK